MKRKDKGKLGESIAEKYLVSKNYEILEKNYHTGFGEIDIIAMDGECLVFIEVKLRKSESYGHILEQISDKQKDRIIRSAEYYFSMFQPKATDCRFDYLAVDQQDEETKITHLKQVFDING